MYFTASQQNINDVGRQREQKKNMWVSLLCKKSRLLEGQGNKKNMWVSLLCRKPKLLEGQGNKTKKKNLWVSLICRKSRFLEVQGNKKEYVGKCVL